MIISTTGSTRKTQKNVKSIVRYCANNLMSSRLTKNISIRIILNNNLLTKYSLYGYCEPNVYDNRSPKDFDLVIDCTQSLKGILSTVSHEMVHVKQFARRELHFLACNKLVRFHDRYYDINTLYARQPWEIEAEDMQFTLYNDWRKTL